jgi:S-adenosylmethionine-diacylglycerol 3-amino-3-carboxypropyl transferase
VLSITSAGDMALSLRALGAARVTGVDTSPAQNHLARLKHASVLMLEPLEAAAFLGYRPASAAERTHWFAAVVPALAEPTAAWWCDQREAVQGGVVWSGRFERFLRRVLVTLRPVLQPRFAELVGAPDLAAQAEVFSHRLDTAAVRALFRVAFHPRLYAQRGMDPRSLQFHDPRTSLGDQFFATFRDMCTRTPAGANPYLQLFTLGRVVDPSALPAWLSDPGAAILRADPGAVRFLDCDVTVHVRSQPTGTYDRFHLSNVTDWLPVAQFDELLGALADRSGRPGRVVWRAIHVDRTVPEELAGRIIPDRAWGAELRAADRFPVYAVVPARIV